MRDRHAWFALLSSRNIRAFNAAQDRLALGEPEINFDGIDMREVDLRGACLKRASLRGCIFDSEEQVEIAQRGGAILDDHPRIGGGGDGPPTHRVPVIPHGSTVEARSIQLEPLPTKRAVNGRA